jgi:signal transduction histidine kinase
MALSLAGLDALPRICADENDVGQLFFSLVENAVQAADGQRDRRLAIRGAVKDRVIELAFADDCGGIAPDHVDQIFDPFFTTKGDAHATGLGLCIVERLVRRIGGKIAVENRPGVGVTFVVTLPVEGET